MLLSLSADIVQLLPLVLKMKLLKFQMLSLSNGILSFLSRSNIINHYGHAESQENSNETNQKARKL